VSAFAPAFPFCSQKGERKSIEEEFMKKSAKAVLIENRDTYHF
jgi:hypothetical protein